MVGVSMIATTEQASVQQIGPPADVDRRCLLSLIGRYTLNGESEYACQTFAMSTSSVEVLAVGGVRVGEHASCDFLYLGAIKGTIDRIARNGFRLALDLSDERRQKLRGLIDLLAEHQSLGSLERRKHPRIALARPAVTVVTKYGQPRRGDLIDVSISGASVLIDEAPPVGSKVRLGSTLCTVVRHLPRGFGVKFDRPLAQLRLDRPVQL
jgi:hypothetical protein